MGHIKHSQKPASEKKQFFTSLAMWYDQQKAAEILSQHNFLEVHAFIARCLPIKCHKINLNMNWYLLVDAVSSVDSHNDYVLCESLLT